MSRISLRLLAIGLVLLASMAGLIAGWTIDGGGYFPHLWQFGVLGAALGAAGACMCVFAFWVLRSVLPRGH